jgi:glycosyltransferase involved in cell wall biosynthesis
VKVCFAVNDLALSGGVGVILEHAHHLAEDHDFDVTLVLRETIADRWAYRRLDGTRVASLDEVQNERFDVAVATWWRTTSDLFEIPADRYAYFVQSMEDRFYPDDTVDRLQAAVTHDLPVSFITEAGWIAETLRELRPDTSCFYVRNGIAKDVFPAATEVLPHTQGPLRVLIEGHPDVWFKAVDEAMDAASRMTEPREVTLVSPEAVRAGAYSSERVIGPLSHRELSAVYSETDVLLKLSRVEGMFGPPLEGFHRGATCVVSPVTGHDEFVVHGWNGVVANWDDAGGTARWLDLLARDRRLLHYLRWNAVRTAQAWPSWRQASQFMAAALLRIKAEPAPSPGPAAVRALGDLKAGTELLRNERIMVEHEVRGRHSELQALLKQHEALLHQHHAVLETRAYRIGVSARELVKRPAATLLGPLIGRLRRAARRVLPRRGQ